MSYKQLTLRERYKIKAYMQAGISKSRIAGFVGVHKGTIHREVNRNKGYVGYDLSSNKIVNKNCVRY